MTDAQAPGFVRWQRILSLYRAATSVNICGRARRLGMLKGFKQFIFRGNVIDLAVAVVIGAAFGAVVTSLVTNILNPLIAAVVAKPDFSAFVFTLNGSRIAYGLFLNALVSFVLVAAAIYFFVVAPMNKLNSLSRSQAPAAPAKKQCPECLSEIPAAARRCAFCTATVVISAAAKA
jgi:large conductance mechanosensitive channel